jgi:hypothetical protein
VPDDKIPQPPAPETPPAVVGGPEAPPPSPPDAPKLVSVRWQGQEFQMPEHAAQAWQEREQTLSRQGQELGDLRRRSQPAQPAQPRDPEAEWNQRINTLWFENPAEAAKLLEERAYRRIAGEYRQDQAMRTFWDEFDRKHGDLREDRWVVEATMSRNWEALADLPHAQAQDKLADLTRNEILRLARKAKPADTNGNGAPPRHLAEPASGDRPPTRRSEDDDDRGPKTLSDAIRSIQRRRGAAERQGAAKE